jgi:hypothetical protein
MDIREIIRGKNRFMINLTGEFDDVVKFAPYASKFLPVGWAMTIYIVKTTFTISIYERISPDEIINAKISDMTNYKNYLPGKNTETDAINIFLSTIFAQKREHIEYFETDEYHTLHSILMKCDWVRVHAVCLIMSDNGKKGILVTRAPDI